MPKIKPVFVIDVKVFPYTIRSYTPIKTTKGKVFEVTENGVVAHKRRLKYKKHFISLEKAELFALQYRLRDIKNGTAKGILPIEIGVLTEHYDKLIQERIAPHR